MLDPRAQTLLKTLIERYIVEGQPVGSRTLSKYSGLELSPATIRNVMADLEELGYLEQPHTSAGRVPSDRGYRYYVDCLMQEKDVSPSEDELIRRAFERKVREIDTLVRETARILSDTTHLTSVVSGPQIEKATFKELRLVPLGGDKAILIYITDSGFIENQVLEMPVEVTMVELQRVSEVLNEQLKGQRVESLSRASIQALQRELSRYGALLDQALQFLELRMEPGDRHRLYLGGTTHMLSQPEFRDVDKLRSLLTLLEHEEIVAGVLEGGRQKDQWVNIQIGEEIQVRELSDCSVVSATYRVGDQVVGRMGVIGPKRMEYGRIVGVMHSITRRLTESMQRNR